MQAKRLVESTVQQMGRLDILVNNAGCNVRKPAADVTWDDWNLILDTNLRGAFFTLKHAGAAMVASGGGSFVGLSSIAGPLTHPFMAAYCVSKAGLEMLVRTAADELGRANVRVNAVRPSIVPTELAAPLEQDPAWSMRPETCIAYPNAVNRKEAAIFLSGTVEDLMESISRAANRLSMSVLIAGTVVGIAVLLLAGVAGGPDLVALGIELHRHQVTGGGSSQVQVAFGVSHHGRDRFVGVTGSAVAGRPGLGGGAAHGKAAARDAR